MQNFRFSGNTIFIRIMKFGLTSALVGLLLHAAWGNMQEIKYTIATGFLTGVILGLIESVFSRPFAKNMPYLVLLLLRTILYYVIILVCVYAFLILYLKSNGLESETLGDPDKFQALSEVYFLVDLDYPYILIIALIGSFFWQLKAFFGKRVLLNYLLGKYRRPIVEERIFMFLDLDNATTIAEKLGPVKYSSLLRNFFVDLDQAFTATDGQVYQYVGDEVVVIWKIKSGLKNNNCIKSFLLAQEILEKNKNHYLKTWGIFPAFKAAFHVGEVSITEIGVSKKEIGYHGDAINTTARICGSAHTLGRNNLISEELYKRLQNEDGLTFVEIGEHSFKGKDEKVVLYSMEML